MKNAWTERIETLERELAECRAVCEQQAELIDLHNDMDELLIGIFRGGEPG